ncbi:MAG: DUF4174 domain-containing protein [Planctomycetaceae bacterium]|nr:DUF4174 domain-containing protein [Planctomycetaceae bacterium]
MKNSLLLACVVLFSVASGCDVPSAPAPPGGAGGNPNVAPPQTAAPAPAKFSLDQYRDKNWVLVVCGDNRDAFISQIRDAQTDIAAKQIVVLELANLSRADVTANIYGGETLSAQAATDLRDIFSPSPTGLTVILVGKDGKIASRETGTVSLTTLLEKVM